MIHALRVRSNFVLILANLLRKLRAFPQGENGRGDRIRTCDICVPNAALYQAELLPADCEVGGKLSDLGIFGKTEFVYSSAISMGSDFTTAGESSG